MTKKDLVEHVSRRTGGKPADVKIFIEEFMDVLTELIGAGNRIELRNFGVFEVRYSREKIAQNPRTLEPVKVPARNTVRFKPGGAMRKKLKATTDKMAADKGAEPEEPFENGSRVPAPVGGPGSNRPHNNGRYIEAKPKRRGGRG